MTTQHAPDRRAGWRIIAPLAVSQTVIWASIFYSFPALLLHFERGLGWSKTELTAAYTGALLVTALGSAPMGRLIDRGYGMQAMLLGLATAALALLLLSQTRSYPVFLALWLVLGLCMAACLYEPCFAMLTRHLGAGARPAITRITLIAGFAGTVSFPAAAYMVSLGGWRAAILLFAAAVAFIALPLAWLGLRQLAVLYPVVRATAGADDAPLPRRRRVFWCLALAFAFATVNHAMILNHMLPLLAERGIALATAIALVSSIGPMQVAGRIAMMASEQRFSTMAIGIVSFISMSAGVVFLIIGGASVWLVAAFVALQGAPWGVLSIIRPALTRDALGEAGFGLASGRISALSWTGSAAAPFLGSLIWQWAGYDAMLIFGFLLLCSATLLLILGLKRRAS